MNDQWNKYGHRYLRFNTPKGKVTVDKEIGFASVFLGSELWATIKAPFFGDRQYYSVRRAEELAPDKQLGDWEDCVEWALGLQEGQAEYYGHGTWTDPDVPLQPVEYKEEKEQQ